MNKNCVLALSLIVCAGTTCAQTLNVEYLVPGNSWADATTGNPAPATISGSDVSIDSVPSGADLPWFYVPL